MEGGEILDADAESIDASVQFDAVVRHAPWDALDCWAERWRQREYDAYRQSDLRGIVRAIERRTKIQTEKQRRRSERDGPQPVDDVTDPLASN